MCCFAIRWDWNLSRVIVHWRCHRRCRFIVLVLFCFGFWGEWWILVLHWGLHLLLVFLLFLIGGLCVSCAFIRFVLVRVSVRTLGWVSFSLIFLFWVWVFIVRCFGWRTYLIWRLWCFWRYRWFQRVLAVYLAFPVRSRFTLINL